MQDYGNSVSKRNAEKVIERFGGIRPMANKMRVPVTTVQGWKKRGIIPENRIEEIIDAAIKNKIDLSDIPGFSAANENAEMSMNEAVSTEEPLDLSQREHSSPGFADLTKKESSETAYTAKKSSRDDTEDLLSRMRGIEKKAVKQSAWITSVLVVLAIAGGAFIMWPTAQKVDSHGRRINALEKGVASLEGEVGVLKKKESLLSKVLPESFNLEEMQKKAGELQETVGALVDTADTASKVLMNPDGSGATLPQRVQRLEAQMKALAGNSGFSKLLSRIDEFKQTVPGQETLNKSVSQLYALANSMEGRMDHFDEALVVAREESEALDTTFEGISNEDLKAAAMLVTMSKLRDTLNRGEKPFEEDLQLLMGMVGEEHPELRSSLEKLAPHADKGVLTTEGLSREFRGMAGDIVVSSLKGEDVSVKEKAKARMNEIFQVEKDGEPVTGTDTQATVAKVENKLSSGNLVQAIEELKALEGPAAQTAMPFMDKAEATLQAQQAKELINNLMGTYLSQSSRAPYTAGKGGFPTMMPDMPALPGGKMPGGRKAPYTASP
jgi:ribosomal protein S16